MAVETPNVISAAHTVLYQATALFDRDILNFLYCTDINMRSGLDPVHQGSTLQISPKELGDVIRNVGTPDFVQALTDFVNEGVGVDAVSLDRSRPDTKSQGGYVTEWIGSGGDNYKLICEVSELYYEVYTTKDPVRAAFLAGETGPRLFSETLRRSPTPRSAGTCLMCLESRKSVLWFSEAGRLSIVCL